MLLIGFFVLITGLIVGFAGLAIYALATGRLAGIKLVIVVGIVIFAIGGALYKVLKHRPQPHGASITREEQPELWRMIDELAVMANTRGPDEVRLVPEVNAAVWEDSKLLGLRPGRRYMEIGLPLLAGLTTSELRAVLGHELGHYSHGHTKYAAVTYRASATMAHTVNELDGPIGWLMRLYMKLYFLVARSANRAQELQADALAVRAAGKSAARSALGKIPALDVAWAHYNRSYVGLVGQAGRTPDLLLGFNSYLTNDKRREDLAALQGEMLDAEPASKYDSHPPIRVRIATIDKMTEPDQQADNRPSWTVLRHPEDTVPRLEGQLLTRDFGPRASWQEIVQLAGAAIDKNNAEALVKLATVSGVTRTGSLDEVLTAIDQGKAVALASPALDEDMHPHDKQKAAVEVLTQLVSDTISLALISSQRAAYELDWSGPMRLRLAGGELLDVSEVVEPAVADPTRMPALREWLARMNVDTGQPSPKWNYDPSAR
ncbi:M48 family metallopeptidase [Kibdelosporangium philippinense]|uniref:M48 family metallopeptidase n=1 Tax=Kibdelosporangium philippinense TaxID=211113 RepID=UPI003622CBA8